MTASNTKHLFQGVCFLSLLCLGSLGWIFLNLNSERTSYITSSSGLATQFDETGVPKCRPNWSFWSSDIPNIVHYMTLDDKELTFLEWLAIRSAIYHLRPDKVYLHGEVEPTGIWYMNLRRHHKIVEFNSVSVPKETIYGKPIKLMAHRSDFLRLAMLYCYGGIYMDTDILVIRSFDPLRKSGFDSVHAAGHKPRTVGFSVWLSKSHNDLLKIHLQNAHRVFDGNYVTHSTRLLASSFYTYREDFGTGSIDGQSSNSSRLSYRPLLLEPSAFFPFQPNAQELHDNWHKEPSSSRLGLFQTSYSMHLYHLLQNQWGFDSTSSSSPSLEWFVAHQNSSVIAHLMWPVLQDSISRKEITI